MQEFLDEAESLGEQMDLEIERNRKLTEEYERRMKEIEEDQ